MVNTRQALRDQLGKDLKAKIESVDQLLSQLKLSLEDVEANSARSKDSIQKNAELMIQEINTRKLGLMNQIDEGAQFQTNLLQDKIQLSYLTLGSLQSMLTNLDSFDHGQLLNLQVPITTRLENDIVSYTNPNLMAPQLNNDSEKIIKDIKSWGKGQTNIDLTVIGSEEKIINKSPSPSFDKEVVGTLLDSWKIENWLSYEDKSHESNADDFEMLNEEINLEEEQKMLEGLTADTVPDVDEEPSLAAESEIMAKISSIPLSDELTKWLKPRMSMSSSMECQVPTVPAEMMQPLRSLTSSNVSSRSHLLDYPGLRLDPKCWLQKKKINERFKLSEEIRLNFSQNEIVPATYTLPYPFWLKKC